MSKHRKQPRDDDAYDRESRRSGRDGRKRRKRQQKDDEWHRLPPGFGPYPEIDDDLEDFDDDFESEFEEEEDAGYGDFRDIEDADEDDSQR